MRIYLYLDLNIFKINSCIQSTSSRLVCPEIMDRQIVITSGEVEDELINSSKHFKLSSRELFALTLSGELHYEKSKLK